MRLLLVAFVLLSGCATSRPGSEVITSLTVSPVESQSRTGAPLDDRPASAQPGNSGLWGSSEEDGAPGAGRFHRPEVGGASPTAEIGQPASAVNPHPPTEGISGSATWWNSFGPGLYAAIRPDLGRKGDLAVVCGPVTSASDYSKTIPFHCLSLPVTTTCQCLGPGSDRLIDLSLDAFRSFADPAVGVVRIVLQVVP